MGVGNGFRVPRFVSYGVPARVCFGQCPNTPWSKITIGPSLHSPGMSGIAEARFLVTVADLASVGSVVHSWMLSFLNAL